LQNQAKTELMTTYARDPQNFCDSVSNVLVFISPSSNLIGYAPVLRTSAHALGFAATGS
jgi:hypothetical protein